uniref:Uncharacterized protein n=1 Tax=Trypanosoma congolense (strain IL3000) TaxID=1068625 RepID=G0UN31_TRYCI|nr:hypothetical protein, unlikely [Trypanosoma congolense IL3000]
MLRINDERSSITDGVCVCGGRFGDVGAVFSVCFGGIRFLSLSLPIVHPLERSSRSASDALPLPCFFYNVPPVALARSESSAGDSCESDVGHCGGDVLLVWMRDYLPTLSSYSGICLPYWKGV